MCFREPATKRLCRIRRRGGGQRAYSRRLQLELLKPEMTLTEHGVKSTVVVFGSARTRSAEQSAGRIAELKKLLKNKPKDAALKSYLASVMRLKVSAKYYEVAREFGK